MKSHHKVIIRIICTILALTVLFTCVPAQASAKESETQYDMLPVIYVTGFGATILAQKDASSETVQAFPPATDKILASLDGRIGKIISGIFSVLLFNNTDPLAAALAPIVAEIIEPMIMNADGSSKYELFPIVSGAENTSLAAFTKNDMLAYVPYTGSEFLDMECVGDIVGDDRVFNFTYDWRMSHLDTVELFRAYIKDVLSLTGADKVNVYSISQGGMIVGEYLYRYADDGYINNAVFDTPVLSGTDLVTDLFSTEPVSFNYNVVADLLEEILHTEFELNGILGIIPASFLDYALDYGLKELVLPKVIGGTAFWDMLPASELDRLEKARLTEANAAIIEKTNEMHSGFMTHVSETFAAAKSNGTVVSVKTCSGLPMASGTVDNSDCIVNVKYSCGAVCAPFGESFPDGYVQKADGVYAVSPDRTVDLSACYYPERTWIINNHFHGQAEWDNNSYNLLMKLLLTDEIEDAYSSYEFPQFTESAAPNTKLSLTFSCTNCGFLPYSNNEFAGNTMTLKNVSLEKNIIVKSIAFESNSLTVKSRPPLRIKSGQSTDIEFDGAVPASRTYDTVTVTYSEGLFAKDKTISFGITILSDYAGVIR